MFRVCGVLWGFVGFCGVLWGFGGFWGVLGFGVLGFWGLGFWGFGVWGFGFWGFGVLGWRVQAFAARTSIGAQQACRKLHRAPSAHHRIIVITSKTILSRSAPVGAYRFVRISFMLFGPFGPLYDTGPWFLSPKQGP